MLRWQFAVWIVVGLVSLLVAGCAPRVEPAVSFTPTHLPTPTSVPTAMSTAMPMFTTVPELTATREKMTFTIVYDNNAYDPALQTAWGFACLVEIGKVTRTGTVRVLFDTGGDGPTLLGNMARLGFDPQAVDVVVLSHAHGDHTGGLAGLLDAGVRPTVYVPAAFSASFKDGVRARTDLVEVTEPSEILPSVYTTGQIGSGIVEQALAVETGDGLVVVTGCAHPGIVEMVRRAREAAGGDVALVMGGFHLGGASRRRIEGIIADFRDLGVRRVAPCHCTGDQARQMFEDAFGADCVLAGVGWGITVGPGEGRSE